MFAIKTSFNLHGKHANVKFRLLVNLLTMKNANPTQFCLRELVRSSISQRACVAGRMVSEGECPRTSTLKISCTLFIADGSRKIILVFGCSSWMFLALNGWGWNGSRLEKQGPSENHICYVGTLLKYFIIKVGRRFLCSQATHAV